MPAAGVKRLSIRERRFLLFHVEGHTLTECYLQLKPEADRETAATLGSRTMRRILQKVDWPKLLDEAGLGDVRLLGELDSRLRAKVTRFYQDKSLGDFEDNATRMRATELLAELLGRRKADISLHVDTVEVIPAPKPPEGQTVEDHEEGKTL